MNIKKTLKLIAACAGATCASATFAHDGHGMFGTHWHATDAWGFIALGGAMAIAIWLSRSGK